MPKCPNFLQIERVDLGRELVDLGGRLHDGGFDAKERMFKISGLLRLVSLHCIKLKLYKT